MSFSVKPIYYRHPNNRQNQRHNHGPHWSVTTADSQPSDMAYKRPEAALGQAIWLRRPIYRTLRKLPQSKPQRTQADAF